LGRRLPYSQFETGLKDARSPRSRCRQFHPGRYKDPQNERPFFLTTRVDPDLARQYLQHGVVVTGQVESTFLRDRLSWLIPMTLFVGVGMS
jgi:cell division protease FtsH